MQITVKSRLIIQFTIGLAMLVSSFNDINTANNVARLDGIESANAAEESIKKDVEHEKEKKTVQETVNEYFENTPILSRVAYCESRYRQFGVNGEVLRGVVNSKDVGVMQINEYYHLDSAIDLGIDIYTLEGNLAYAKHLYEEQGVGPWVHSSNCWNKGESIVMK